MSEQLQKHKLYDGTIKRLLLYTGLRPVANSSNLYRLVLVAHGLPAVVTTCAILNFCYHHFTSLALLFKGLGLCFSFLSAIQKTICLTVYRNRLVEVHDSLARTFGHDLKDPDLRPILLSPLPSFFRPSVVLGILSYAVLTMYWTVPLIGVAVQLYHNADVIECALPYPARYPWTVSNDSWLFPFHYAMEVYAGISLGAFTVTIDGLFGYYIFQISGQLRTLSKRLTTVKSTENYHRVLRKCVARHQILIRCQKHLERIYGPIVLWLLVTSAMVMCALIHQASHASPGKATLAVVYIIMKSIQVLIYGFFGTFLTNENDKFREAIYCADWAGSGEKCFMTDVLIIVTYEPLVLRACSLSIISVNMYGAVVNTAMSYFFMLRTLEEGRAS